MRVSEMRRKGRYRCHMSLRPGMIFLCRRHDVRIASCAGAQESIAGAPLCGLLGRQNVIFAGRSFLIIHYNVAWGRLE